LFRGSLALRDLAASRQGGSGEVNIQIIDADYHAFTNNGITSYYSVVTDQVSWDSARASALSSSFLGLSGYLANITSAEENSFLSEKTGAIGWIGGSDATVENKWIWVDGPEAGTQFWQGVANGSVVNGMYNAWTAGVQPNNSGGQDYLRFNDPAGKWNDWDGAAQASVLTYIIEYGGTSSASQIAGITLKVDYGLSSPTNSPVFQVGAFTKSTYTASAFRDARIATNNRDTAAGDTFQDLATRILDIVNTASSRTSSNFAKISNLVDDVVTEIAARRTALGSMQNRLLATIQNDNRQSEGLQRSKSMVMETDFAAETARLTRMQIGQQAATAALAQANAMPNVVLALLK